MRSEVLALPDNDRAELVIDLLDSLDDRPSELDQPALDDIWAVETANRAAQLESGEAVTVSWDEVLTRVAESRRRR